MSLGLLLIDLRYNRLCVVENLVTSDPTLLTLGICRALRQQLGCDGIKECINSFLVSNFELNNRYRQSVKQRYFYRTIVNSYKRHLKMWLN